MSIASRLPLPLHLSHPSFNSHSNFHIEIPLVPNTMSNLISHVESVISHVFYLTLIAIIFESDPVMIGFAVATLLITVHDAIPRIKCHGLNLIGIAGLVFTIMAQFIKTLCIDLFHLAISVLGSALGFLCGTVRSCLSNAIDAFLYRSVSTSPTFLFHDPLVDTSKYIPNIEPTAHYFSPPPPYDMSTCDHFRPRSSSTDNLPPLPRFPDPASITSIMSRKTARAPCHVSFHSRLTAIPAPVTIVPMRPFSFPWAGVDRAFTPLDLPIPVYTSPTPVDLRATQLPTNTVLPPITNAPTSIVTAPISVAPHPTHLPRRIPFTPFTPLLDPFGQTPFTNGPAGIGPTAVESGTDVEMREEAYELPALVHDEPMDVDPPSYACTTDLPTYDEPMDVDPPEYALDPMALALQALDIYSATAMGSGPADVGDEPIEGRRSATAVGPSDAENAEDEGVSAPGPGGAAAAIPDMAAQMLAKFYAAEAARARQKEVKRAEEDAAEERRIAFEDSGRGKMLARWKAAKRK